MYTHVSVIRQTQIILTSLLIHVSNCILVCVQVSVIYSIIHHDRRFYFICHLIWSLVGRECNRIDADSGSLITQISRCNGILVIGINDTAVIAGTTHINHMISNRTVIVRQYCSICSIYNHVIFWAQLILIYSVADGNRLNRRILCSSCVFQRFFCRIFHCCVYFFDLTGNNLILNHYIADVSIFSLIKLDSYTCVVFGLFGNFRVVCICKLIIISINQLISCIRINNHNIRFYFISTLVLELTLLWVCIGISILNIHIITNAVQLQRCLEIIKG